MQKGQIKDLTTRLAMNAVKINLQHNLPMADSIIFATAITYKCTVWTQDLISRTLQGLIFPQN